MSIIKISGQSKGRMFLLKGCVDLNFRLMIGTMIFLVLSTSIVSAYEDSDIQWSDGILSHSLKREDTFSYLDYSIKVTGFPSPVESDIHNRTTPSEEVSPFVGLTISKEDNIVDTIVLLPYESYIVPDKDMKITVKELPSGYSSVWLFESYDPTVTLEFRQRGTPGIRATIETDDENYISSSFNEIVATIKIENPGSADLVDIDLKIETELSLIKGVLKYHFEKIGIDETVVKTIRLSVPSVQEEETYRLFVNASGYDIKGLLYISEYSKNVKITPETRETLSIKKSTITETMYLKDNAMITLLVKNRGKSTIKNVNITDAIPEGFEVLGNDSLHWKVDIPANGEFEYRYLVKPLYPSNEGLVIPPATAEFTVDNEFYQIRSGELKIIVYGPRVRLTKQTDITEAEPGDSVLVTVIAENNGSTPTRATIIDDVPENVNIVSGITALEDFLDVQSRVSFSYTIEIEDLPLELPPAKVDYFELGNKGRKITANSQGIVIKMAPPPDIIVNEPDPEPDTTPEVVTPTPEPTPEEPEIPSPEPVDTPESSREKTRLKMPIDTPEFNEFFMNTMLGCEEKSTNFTQEACEFFKVAR